MSFSLLAGNAALKRQLSLEVCRGLSHAYIISGPAGSGKETLAGLLSAALVCVGEKGKPPCLSCVGCKKALAGIHPDIITAGGQEYPLQVDRIRALRRDAYIKPNEAPRKVYILRQADEMRDSAQNAMLKLLEEGPSYAAFLLLASNPGSLLETVRSRCELLTLSPVSLEEAEVWLAKRFPDVPMQERQAAAEHCGGILGRAVAELEGASIHTEAADGAAELLRRLCGRNPLSVMEFCTGLERDKWDRDGMLALLDEFLLLLRDALAYASGANCESDPRRRPFAQQAAQSLSFDALMKSAELTQQLQRAGEFNLGTGHLAGWLGAGLNGLT